MSMKIGNSSANKGIWTVLIILVIVFGFIAVLKIQNFQTNPEWVSPAKDENVKFIQMILVKVNFAGQEPLDINFEERYLNPAIEYFQHESEGRAKVGLATEYVYEANFTEIHYGENMPTQIDVGIDDLRQELSQFLLSSHVVIAIHTGVAEQLRIGNDTGIMDQYFGALTGYRDGIVILSQASPYGVLLHELGHFLGLPDMRGNYEGALNQFGLMGTGLWHSYDRDEGIHGSEGTDPAELCYWSKYQLGWLSYWNITNSRSGTYNLNLAIVNDNLVLQWFNDPSYLNHVDFGGIMFDLDLGIAKIIHRIGSEQESLVFTTKSGDRYEYRFDTVNAEVKIKKLINFNWTLEDVIENLTTIVMLIAVVILTTMAGKKIGSRRRSIYK